MKQKNLLLHLLPLTILIILPVLAKKDEKENKEKPSFDTAIYNWSRTFAEVAQLTNQKHYKVGDPEKCMIQAIDSFVNCLDPHSNFLDPKTYKNIMESTQGAFFGIGVVIDNTRKPADKTLTIIDTIPEGPSDKAGLRPQDKIVEVNGESLDGMSTDEVTAKLKGERNTKVHVTILREGQTEPLSFDITRDEIKEQNSLCFYLKDQNIYYLALTMFTETAHKQISALLKKSNEKPYKGLILDLRNNSGGLLNAAIDIAGLFLEPDSLVVVTKNKENKEIERYTTKGNPIANAALPIFILINNYTASAAEILSGVLKIHSDELNTKSKNKNKKLMVFLVGTKSFGKGSVQEVISVSNDCAVKLTTSLYFLPNDTTIQGTGIEPDFVIERQIQPTEQMQWFNKFYGRERALGNYIKPYGHENDEDEEKKEKERIKKEKEKKEKNWAERAKGVLQTDNQFREAVNLINLYHTTVKCHPQAKTRKEIVTLMKENFITNDSLQLEEVKI